MAMDLVCGAINRCDITTVGYFVDAAADRFKTRETFAYTEWDTSPLHDANLGIHVHAMVIALLRGDIGQV